MGKLIEAIALMMSAAEALVDPFVADRKTARYLTAKARDHSHM